MKKDAIINFKVPLALRDEFNILCNRNYTTPSHELRQFVHRRIQELKNK